MNQSLTAEFDQVIPTALASGVFASLCTIKAPTQSLDGLGQVDLSDYVAVPGMVDIPCMKPPLMIRRMSGLEVRRADAIAQQSTFHVLLAGYYPAIEQKQQAKVDGTGYEIMTVEFDSQRRMTRLALQEYSL